MPGVCSKCHKTMEAYGYDLLYELFDGIIRLSSYYKLAFVNGLSKELENPIFVYLVKDEISKKFISFPKQKYQYDLCDEYDSLDEEHDGKLKNISINIIVLISRKLIEF